MFCDLHYKKILWQLTYKKNSDRQVVQMTLKSLPKVQFFSQKQYFVLKYGIKTIKKIILFAHKNNIIFVLSMWRKNHFSSWQCNSQAPSVPYSQLFQTRTIKFLMFMSQYFCKIQIHAALFQNEAILDCLIDTTIKLTQTVVPLYFPTVRT